MPGTCTLSLFLLLKPKFVSPLTEELDVPPCSFPSSSLLFQEKRPRMQAKALWHGAGPCSGLVARDDVTRVGVCPSRHEGWFPDPSLLSGKCSRDQSGSDADVLWGFS